jgi:filamentous hemagglutinin
MSYDKAVDLVATQFEVPEEKEVVILGLEGVTCHEDNNVHEHESKQKKEARGLFGRSSTNHFQSSSQTSIGVKVKGGKSRIISAGNIVLTNVDFETNETILTAFDGVVKILPGTNYFTSAFSGKSADMFWQSMTQRLVQQKTYTDSKFKGTIETYAKEVVLQQVCGRTLAFMDRLNLNGATLTFDYVQELYDVKEHNVSGPTAALSAVIALAASIAAVATGGAAAAGAMAVSTTGATGATAGIISAMGYAGFSALCAQATMSLVQNKLHIGRAAKDLVGKDSIKALLTAMAAAGLVAGIGQALNVPVSAADAKGIVDHFQRQALQQGVQAAFSLADGQRLDPQRIAVSVAAQSLGAIGANKIGEYYTNQMVDGVTHKLLHLGMAYGIGGLSGALTGDDVGRQALASGIGALAAETMHDIIKEDETSVAQRVAQKAGERGIALGDTARTRPIILDEIRARLEVSKFAGAMAAFFAKQDVSTASTAATTAIENNSAQALVAAVDVVLLARAAILGIPLASAGTIGFGSKGKKQPTSIKELKEELGISSMDAVPEDAGFKDKGITPVDARQEPLSTPMPEERRSEPLATPVADTLPTSEGFGAYDGPSASVLENSIKGRLKTAGLPTEGKIRFVPRQDYYPSQPLPKGDGGGYLDRFGNEWVAGASRTAGQTFEWDVQLSRQGASQLGWASRDKKHLNVSLDGKITHK